MSIPALVLEWLELEAQRHRNLAATMPAREFTTDRLCHLAKDEAYRNVLEKLKGLDS